MNLTEITNKTGYELPNMAPLGNFSACSIDTKILEKLCVEKTQSLSFMIVLSVTVSSIS